MPRHDDTSAPAHAPTDGLTGVLLAGGSGRRAGVDKRYLVLGGRTLLRRNLGFLRRHFRRVVLSVGDGPLPDLGDAADEARVDLVRDAWPGASPLAGISTVLARERRPLFVMAADLAFPDGGALERVLVAARGHDVAIPAIGEHHEPLFAVYGPACLAPMTALLGSGRHRIVEILPAVDVAEVRFPDESLFRNINTLDDYEEARRAMRTEALADATNPALVAVVAKSDSGKTTFIEKLLPELIKLGLRVGTVKHDAHSFEIDHPGKDSWRHGHAGAEAYVVSSPQRLAYITTVEREIPLTEIARRFFAGVDLVVAEGYKRTAPHMIEVFRHGAGHAEPLCGAGESLALVTDTDLPHEHRFALDDAAGVARFLAARLDTLRRY
jgi:molybdopterin-guanine dinucleotide biosynthesis protein B/molybdopterin-guanine dinucleotide biosynthesis protein